MITPVHPRMVALGCNDTIKVVVGAERVTVKASKNRQYNPKLADLPRALSGNSLVNGLIFEEGALDFRFRIEISPVGEGGVSLRVMAQREAEAGESETPGAKEVGLELRDKEAESYLFPRRAETHALFGGDGATNEADIPEFALHAAFNQSSNELALSLYRRLNHTPPAAAWLSWAPIGLRLVGVAA